jgi:Ca2+-binding RTX toxin-like protein
MAARVIRLREASRRASTPARPRRLWLSAVVGLSLAAVQLVLIAPAAFAISCSLNGHVATATLAPSDTGGSAFVSRDATNLLFGGQVCGALDQVDTLNIDMADQVEALGINLQNGPLGPGSIVETDGTSEIEINAVHVNVHSQFGVIATTGDDFITVGQRLNRFDFVFDNQVNLNAGVEGSSPDVDVVFRGGGEIGLSGLAGSDTLRADGTQTLLSQISGRPVVFNDGPDADTIVGGAGDDYFSTGPFGQGDSYTGGGGIDQLDMRQRTAGLSISLNDVADDGEGCPGAGCEIDNVKPDVETIEGGSGPDTIVGGPGAQLMFPGQGANTLFGGPGADTFFATGAGADVVHGGKGIDGVSYRNHAAGVLVTLDGTANDGAGAEGDNIFADVESVEGSADGDQIRGSAKANRLSGGPGNDLLFGLGGNDVLDGGGGPVFPGTENDGSDSFSGGSGTDTVLETNHIGDMRLSIDGIANDAVNGDPGQGTDNIATNVENVVAGPGNDVVRGSPGKNKLTGGGGNDDLRGGDGADVLVPGAGDDSLSGGNGDDTGAFTDAAGAITASLGAPGTADGDGHDTLASVEALVGSPNGDHLTGSPNPDVLKGAAGDDLLKGLAGNDRLFGGPDDDTLNGGPGTDTCLQGTGTGSKTGCEH